MQKREWNSFVRDRLSIGSEVGDQISTMDWRIIDVYIERAITSRLGNMVKEAIEKTKDLSFLDVYTKTFYNIPVFYDGSRQLYYSYIPAVIQLMEGHEIRSITPMTNESITAARVPNDAMKAFKKLEISKVITDILPYMREGNKIFYTSLTNAKCGMLYKLIIPYTDWDDYDEIPEPYFRGAIAQDYSEDILGAVIKQLVEAKKDPNMKEDKSNQGEPV
jgi:hypothetical protein